MKISLRFEIIGLTSSILPPTSFCERKAKPEALYALFMSVVGGSDDFSKYKSTLRTGLTHGCGCRQLNRLGACRQAGLEILFLVIDKYF
jgi:hypothetical protein